MAVSSVVAGMVTFFHATHERMQDRHEA